MWKFDPISFDTVLGHTSDISGRTWRKTESWTANLDKLTCSSFPLLRIWIWNSTGPTSSTSVDPLKSIPFEAFWRQVSYLEIDLVRHCSRLELDLGWLLAEVDRQPSPRSVLLWRWIRPILLRPSSYRASLWLSGSVLLHLHGAVFLGTRSRSHTATVDPGSRAPFEPSPTSSSVVSQSFQPRGDINFAVLECIEHCLEFVCVLFSGWGPAEQSRCSSTLTPFSQASTLEKHILWSFMLLGMCESKSRILFIYYVSWQVWTL